MKRKVNITTSLNHLNQVCKMLVLKKSGKLSKYLHSDKKKWVADTHKMQTILIMNKQIFLTNLKRYAVVVAILLLGPAAIHAQDTLFVKGQIVNGANEPVSNVSVAVEGSFELPAVTNEAGEFEIAAPNGSAWLNIEPSSVYKKKRVFLNNRTTLKIYLTDTDVPAGNDMISILEQDHLKRNIVAAYSSVDPKDIKHTPALSIDQYLQGRVSGLHITNRSGMPGSGAVSLLRGVNSLNTSNTPLYLVDGIPVTSMGIFGSNLEGFTYNPLLSVNPLDISQVTIVKDPVITAAYGSKASNGIIMIETLDPSATQTVIDLDLRSGYSLAPSNKIPQLNGTQHKTLISESLFSSGLPEEIMVQRYQNLYLTEKDDRWIDYQHNTDWQDMIFGDAVFSNINVNVKGGDEIARYGLSIGYMNADGIIKTTGYDGYNLRFVSLLNIFTWLKMNAGVSLAYNNSQLKESGKVDETSPILTALGKSPLLNPFQYDEEGRELTALSEVDELGVSNPQAVIDNYEAKNSNFNFISTLGFQAQLKENLQLNTNFGLTYNVLKEQLFMPNRGMELYYDNEAINVSKASNNSLNTFYNNSYLLFNKAFGKNHHLTSNTGLNILNNNFEFDWGLTKNAHSNDEYRMLQDGINNLREIGGQNRIWNWISVYEYLTYSYKDKYLVSATVSLDGSSRIGNNAANTLKIADYPFGLFYAGGLAWRVSSEPFLKNVSGLEELKFRVTYGLTGNDDIGESNASNYYNAVKFRETVGLYPAVILNDELTYETVSQLDAGVDISLWGNRVRGSVDVYQSTTDNMLIYTPLKAYFGYDFRPENGGQMQNKGIDADIFLRIVDRPAFKWDVQASFSTVQNEVTEIKGDKLVTEIQGAEIINMPGKNANSFYGYIFDGVYQTTAEAEGANLLNEKLLRYHAGDAKFRDISGPAGSPDGIINDYDKTVIGSSLPEYFGGLSNTFTYKRWSLNSFVQMVSGNEVFNYIRYKNESMTGLENQSTSVLNRWQYEGQETDVPRALWEDPIGNSSFSTRWIEDGTYIRVKNVSLSYTIPDEFLSFRNARFYISASNVFTFTHYLGYDPEFSYSRSHVTQGIDYGLMPQPRQFIVGVKLGL